MNQDLVSIIMPLYNAQTYVEEAIHSVLSQTYIRWELIIIDDHSTDSSYNIVKGYAEKDNRIKLLQTEKASGSPAIPRNIGIEYATGRYIAFLDSDDVWLPMKLEEQLPLFEDDNAKVVFSYYRKMNAESCVFKGIVKSPKKIDYKGLLKGNVIGNLTGIYDTLKTGKHYYQNVGHEDYVYWLHILKSGGYATNTQKVHAQYRITSQSVSSNKLKVATWDWHIYRDIEHLNFMYAVYCFCSYAIKGLIKYFK